MNLSALSPAFLTISPSPSTSQSPSFFISFPFASPKLSLLPSSPSDSIALQHPSSRRSAFSCLFCSLDSKPMPNFVEEDREAFASGIGLKDDNEQAEKSTRKRTFLAAKSEQELLYGIKKEVEAGRLPLNVAAGMEELYQNYRNAVLQSGIPNAKDVILSNMATALDCVLLDVEEPYVFSPYHRALREPFDYYNFGQNYIRPLVDFRNSYVGNISLFNEVEEKLQKGHNIIFISNHQTEADPAVIALSLEKTNPYISENLIYVAGDRVVTDPLCKPFSMGRNLICVYSKKHMDDVPELTEMKKKANIRSLKDMASILREGSHIIWISPSGGRDRPDPLTGEWYPAPFDASAVDNMRRLAEHSGAPGHFYPLALLCHDIMPPPPQVEKEIGEKRLVAFHGTGVSIAPEINFSEIAVSCESSDKAKMAYSQALYDSVCEQYKVLNSAIHGKQGLEASTSSVCLSQPWN